MENQEFQLSPAGLPLVKVIHLTDGEAFIKFQNERKVSIISVSPNPNVNSNAGSSYGNQLFVVYNEFSSESTTLKV